MKALLAFGTMHPVWAALAATFAGLVLLLLLTGLSSAALRRPYGHPAPEILGRALFAAELLLLLWQLGGLEGAGVVRWWCSGVSLCPGPDASVPMGCRRLAGPERPVRPRSRRSLDRRHSCRLSGCPSPK